MEFELIDFEKIWLRTMATFRKVIVSFVCCEYSLVALNQSFFNGPNKETSAGCKRCVAFANNAYNMIWLRVQNS